MYNKYDILNMEIILNHKSLFNSMKKFFDLLSKIIENKKISKEIVKLETSKIFLEYFPIVLSNAHMNYEISKEMGRSIENERLEEYFDNNNIKKDKFYSNYSKNLNFNVKVLLMFALFERENFDIFSVDDPKLIMNILKVNNIYEVLKEKGNLSCYSSYKLANKLNNNFKYCDLDSEELKILEEYHNKYMENIIYPKVTKNVVEIRQVMRLSKRLGRHSFNKA